jgi:hypothetical protein
LATKINRPTFRYESSLNLDGVLLSKLFGRVETGIGIHNRAQRRLLELGKELGFYSIIEYGVPDLTNEGRRSYIDNVWKSKRGLEFAFEVRRKINDLHLITTRKDTNKLQNLIAERKFVVNVSEMTGRAYFCCVEGEPNEVSDAYNEAPLGRLVNNIDVFEKKAYSVATIRQKYPKAYAKWTSIEDQELARIFNEGISITELSARFQRKRGAITSRLSKLGLIK